jgi:hypothetical protein
VVGFGWNGYRRYHQLYDLPCTSEYIKDLAATWPIIALLAGWWTRNRTWRRLIRHRRYKYLWWIVLLAFAHWLWPLF